MEFVHRWHTCSTWRVHRPQFGVENLLRMETQGKAIGGLISPFCKQEGGGDVNFDEIVVGFVDRAVVLALAKDERGYVFIRCLLVPKT